MKYLHDPLEVDLDEKRPPVDVPFPEGNPILVTLVIGFAGVALSVGLSQAITCGSAFLSPECAFERSSSTCFEESCGDQWV